MPVRDRYNYGKQDDRYDWARGLARGITGGLEGFRAGQADADRRRAYDDQHERFVRAAAEAEEEQARREGLRELLKATSRSSLERAQARRAEITGENDLDAKWADREIEAIEQHSGLLDSMLQYLDDDDMRRILLNEDLLLQRAQLDAKDRARAHAQIQSGVKHGWLPEQDAQAMLELLQVGTPVDDVRKLVYKHLDGAAQTQSLQEKLAKGQTSWAGFIDSVASGQADEATLKVLRDAQYKWVMGGYEQESVMDSIKRAVRVLDFIERSGGYTEPGEPKKPSMWRRMFDDGPARNGRPAPQQQAAPQRPGVSFLDLSPEERATAIDALQEAFHGGGGE